jgi:hypothetical protein
VVRGWRADLSLGWLIVLAACTSSAKPEAASLAAAVDRFRQAENAEKPARLPEVEAVACTDKEVCAAKEVCLAYARPTVEGLVLKSEVQRGLNDLEQKRLDPDAEAARALPKKLDAASRALERGHASLAECDAKVMGLRVKYGI